MSRADTAPGMPAGMLALDLAAAHVCRGVNGTSSAALCVRGRLLNRFVAYDTDGTVYVHVVLAPFPTATRIHGYLRCGKGEQGEAVARKLLEYLRSVQEAELRGTDLRTYGPVMLDSSPTHFELRGAWLAGVWPAPQPPTAPTSAATTEPPAACATRAAA